MIQESHGKLQEIAGWHLGEGRGEPDPISFDFPLPNQILSAVMGDLSIEQILVTVLFMKLVRWTLPFLDLRLRRSRSHRITPVS